MSELIFLGTGASSGTPMLACNCKVCSSNSKFNKRLRPSILLKINNQNILIDVGPDVRYQLLKNKVLSLNSFILTHAHYDHLGGLDDLREYYRRQQNPLKCYLSRDTYYEVRKKFPHLFQKNFKNHTQSAKFDFHVLKKDDGIFKIDGRAFEYFSYFQDLMKVTGIKVKNIAYVTDIKRYEEKIFSHLQDIDVLIVSALRDEVSPVHFNLEEAIEFSKKTSAKKVYLTHLGHEVDYKINTTLPKKIKLAYDGLKFEF